MPLPELERLLHLTVVTNHGELCKAVQNFWHIRFKKLKTPWASLRNSISATSRQKFSIMHSPESRASLHYRFHCMQCRYSQRCNWQTRDQGYWSVSRPLGVLQPAFHVPLLVDKYFQRCPPTTTETTPESWCCTTWRHVWLEYQMEEPFNGVVDERYFGRMADMGPASEGEADSSCMWWGSHVCTWEKKVVS